MGGTPKAAVTARIAGAHLVLTRGFLGVATVLLASTLLPTGLAHLGNWLGGLAFGFIYAASVGFHEGAHVLAAVKRGFRVTTVRLTWSGGETHYEGDAEDSTPPPFIAGAGLLASGLAAALFISVVVAEGASGHPRGWVGYVTFAAEVNALLAVVNALPLRGSDGFYVFRRAGAR